MLSICIPIYNYDVTFLVSALKKQIIHENLICEVLLVDDCSSDMELFERNKKLVDNNTVSLIRLDENSGRSLVRNFLASKASYPSLLFLDCDTCPVNDNFLLNYYLEADSDVVVGGIAYRDKMPDERCSLRWNYGRRREEIKVSLRVQNPYASFMTGNFMVKKSVFERIKFNESITQYGHEDTLFGIQLKQLGIAIKHIDNPVFHEGIESNETFIAKTKAGIENLIYLYRNTNNREDFARHVKLVKYYRIICSMGLVPIVAWCYRVGESRLLTCLNKKEPNLKLFDVFKLGYLCNVSLKS